MVLPGRKGTVPSVKADGGREEPNRDMKGNITDVEENIFDQSDQLLTGQIIEIDTQNARVMIGLIVTLLALSDLTPSWS